MNAHRPEFATPDDIRDLHTAIGNFAGQLFGSTRTEEIHPEILSETLSAIFPPPSASDFIVRGYELDVAGPIEDEPCPPWKGLATKNCSVVRLNQFRESGRSVEAIYSLSLSANPAVHDLSRNMQWPVDADLDPPGEVEAMRENYALAGTNFRATGLSGLVLRQEARALIDLLAEFG